MPREHIDELRIGARARDSYGMTYNHCRHANRPELKANADRRRKRAIQNGDGSRRAAEQDGLSQRPVQRHIEIHETTAPPAKLKNVRKNDEAANAIDNPNTICTSLRKPPLVSPNAS